MRASIEGIKKEIVAGLSPFLEEYGLEKAGTSVFWHREPEITRIVEIQFLRKKEASYFGATTASFSILFGGLYGALDVADREDFPAVHYCHVRGHLRRDFRQSAPDPSLPKWEHDRTDIWWVDRTTDSARAAIESAGRVMDRELKTWLRRLQNRRYLCRYLYWSKESDGKLYGFGRKGSPARAEALRRICAADQDARWRKWRVLLPGWLASGSDRTW
jgi:hypothetical protein